MANYLEKAVEASANNSKLRDSVDGLVRSLKAFAAGKLEIAKLVEHRDEVMKLLECVPGSFLLTSCGESIWGRLTTTRPDPETAQGIAGDLIQALEQQRNSGSLLSFVDDTFTVIHCGKPFPPLEPLAYAVLKVLYTWSPTPVHIKDLVTYIDDPDLIRGRSRRAFPVIDRGDAGQQQIKRALRSLPMPLRQMLDGNRNGRFFVGP